MKLRKRTHTLKLRGLSDEDVRAVAALLDAIDLPEMAAEVRKELK